MSWLTCAASDGRLQRAIECAISSLEIAPELSISLSRNAFSGLKYRCCNLSLVAPRRSP